MIQKRMGVFFEGRRVCASETSAAGSAVSIEFAVAFEEDPHAISVRLRPLPPWVGQRIEARRSRQPKKAESPTAMVARRFRVRAPIPVAATAAIR